MEIRKQAAAPASTILWIDDEARGDDAIVSLMGLEGFDVEVADNGADGVRLAQQRRFDAIVLDLKLADMYGLTVLRRLAREKVSTPVVVVTGCYSEPEVEADALEAGAVAFARKPLIAEHLVRVCAAAWPVLAWSGRP